MANFIQTEVLGGVSTDGLGATFPVSAEQVAELLKLVETKAISGKQAKEVYAKIVGTERSPSQVVSESGFAQMSDAGELEVICQRVVAGNEKQAAAYRSGKDGAARVFRGAGDERDARQRQPCAGQRDPHASPLLSES